MRLVAVDPTYAEPYEPYSRTLVYAPGDPGVGSVPQITTIAHDPSASGALYGIDSARSTLVRIGAFGAAPDSNEAQRVHTVAPLTGLPDGATVYALEITSDGTALALSRLSWRTGVSRIDLTTGEATVLRDLADPIVDAIDLALAPTATLPAASALDVRLARVRTVYSPGNTYESIDVRGSISLLPGDLAGNSLRVDVGGAVVEFTIRRTGRAAWVGVAGRGRDSIRLRAVRLRGGDRRIDYVMRLQPNFSDNRNKMELMPGGLGPFVSYVGLSFDGATFVATTQFQKVAKRFGSRGPVGRRGHAR
jgi:hypothetical protein